MGVAYSVGEVDHLYPFFMKKHCRAQHFRKKYKNRFFADKNVINGLFSQLNNNLKAANNWEYASAFAKSERRVQPQHIFPLKFPLSESEIKKKKKLMRVYNACCLDGAGMEDLIEIEGAMKIMLENVMVLFRASDCVEPYVKFITVKQAKQHISLCNLEDFEKEEQEFQEVENELPVLSDQSLLLGDHHLKTLVAHLPPRTQGYRWNLVYSTAIHGSSLKTLYRNMAGLDSPVLLVIKDMHKKVFGAFSSDPFRISKYCYGTGETFLFTFSADFQQYKWSGENSYFVSGDLGSLQIGGGGGGFALWLDADLYHGASFSSSTFHNATLSTHEDFIVQDAEVWTVQN